MPCVEGQQPGLPAAESLAWRHVADLGVAGCSHCRFLHCRRRVVRRRSSPSETTALTLPDETLPAVEASESIPSGGKEPGASTPPEDFGAFLDIETDPFFERQSRPRLAANPMERWSVAVGRVTVPFADAVGEVILLHTITPDGDQALVAFSRVDGAVVWSSTRTKRSVS